MVDWGDVPTWVTAGVALAALLAAVRAYQDQSAGLKKQAEAVELQRQQFTDQTRIQEREQANQVDVEWHWITASQVVGLGNIGDQLVHMVVVTNGSKRPIRNVECQLDAILSEEDVPNQRRKRVITSGRKRADVSGDTDTSGLADGEEPPFGFGPGRGGGMSVVRAGCQAAFVWNIAVGGYVCPTYWVRFTDDADLLWQIDDDLHLQKLASRDW